MSCLVLTGLGVLVVVILAVLKKLGILYQLFHKVGAVVGLFQNDTGA